MSYPNMGIFEVDLVFPRNVTYTPQALMPIVWALQNPSMAPPLASYITWNLWEGNNYSSPGSLDGGLIELLEEDPSSKRLISRFFNTIDYPDGYWNLTWSLEISNCSRYSGPPHTLTRSGSTVFTISKSGQEPDLVAATSAGQCGAMEAYAFNVTSFGSACGHLGQTPTTNPCAVNISSSAASSLYASATAWACAPNTPVNPNVTCPTITSTSSASNPASRSRMATAPALLMLLVWVINLILMG
ncbi:uncharacterized protein N7498_003620 [Penicillium cinerascens]|uniref:DUF7136 domain-containing protein n=1 Tax=Penicillium cinerascens TaxID=70096 RepID=A0A9W9N3A4_9EURO|nr:uncharacterized protein N7498_003620 [Penicillium cinerascens]KAJ5211974.1 hypothetical protein N7498_003620 [Penicillium cinerascens]